MISVSIKCQIFVVHFLFLFTFYTMSLLFWSGAFKIKKNQSWTLLSNLKLLIPRAKATQNTSNPRFNFSRLPKSSP